MSGSRLGEIRRIGAGVQWSKERPGSRAWLDLGMIAVGLPAWRWLSMSGAVDLGFEEERLDFVRTYLEKNPTVHPDDVWAKNHPRVRWLSGVRDDGALLFQGAWGLAEDAANQAPALWHPWASAWLRELCREAWHDPRLTISAGADSRGPLWLIEARRADLRFPLSWGDVRDVVRMPACRIEVVAWLRCLALAPPTGISRRLR